MARKSYIQIGGKLYDKSLPLPDDVRELRKSASVMGDLPDFISPIDGSVVSGRAGLREHCRLHDVVPTSELKGLPTSRPTVQPDLAGIREALKRAVYK